MNRFSIKGILTEILYGTKLCESANQQNIVDFFYDHLLLEKLLVGEPVHVPELRKILRNKILNFEFIKLDGEVRPARGTTMMKYIPTPDHPKGIRASSPKVATFFDLEKKAWRSVSQRSKEIVLKYAFGEKGEKKPVFVVRDKDSTSTTGKPEFSEPTTTSTLDFEDPFVSTTTDKVDVEDVEDVTAVSMPDVKPVEKEEDAEYFGDGDFLSKDDVEDVKATSKPDIEPISKPEIKPVSKSPKYGWKIKQKHTQGKPDIKPIVRPSITAKPKSPVIQTPVPPGMKDETEVLIPKEITLQHPYVRPSLPTKEPPLEIEPDEDEI